MEKMMVNGEVGRRFWRDSIDVRGQGTGWLESVLPARLCGNKTVHNSSCRFAKLPLRLVYITVGNYAQDCGAWEFGSHD